MRFRGAGLAVCACALAACVFSVDGVLVPEADDLAIGGDLAGEPDAFPIIDGGPLDLSEDLASNVDFASVDFTTPPIDLAGADLTPTVAGFPSHVAYHYLADSAADWTVAGNTTINTTTLSISSPIPAGLVITVDGPYTVLAVRKLSIGTMMTPDVRLTVTGARPLVIVAGEEIHVWGLIDAGAHSDSPGPAGGRPATGDGAGNSGMNRAGGGGAGYGAVGGTGGGSPATGAGGVYGDATLTPFAGGSGGGAGAAAQGALPAGCSSPAPGGAGGGVLQLSSRKIVVESSTNAARGTISVAGGAGSGGCGTALGGVGGGGGGGGSGGSLLIESPSLQLNGRIVGAGGGGAGGGSVGFLPAPSDLSDGGDGLDGFVAALPGVSSYGGYGLSAGGGGYNGITLSPPSAKGGSWSDAGNWGGGGGGGGPGRIRIRASVAVNPPNTTPAPTVVVDLPSTIP